ncbi:hypothetical protein APSETT444_008883 [Aspergillus pseudonomiae]
MLIGTLSMIEGPHGQPSTAGNATYITSSLRNTINHLRTHVGNSFYLRGFALVLVHDIARDTILPALLPMNGNSPLNRDLCSLISVAALANLQVLWVHIVITRPSPKFLYQRLPKEVRKHTMGCLKGYSPNLMENVQFCVDAEADRAALHEVHPLHLEK